MSVNIKQNGELIKIANNASIVQADWNDRENPNKNTCIKNQPETIKTLEEINSNVNENSLAGATAVKELNIKLDKIPSQNLGVNKTAVDNSIYLDDAANSKLVEFTMYGKANQNTTTGKNLLQYPFYETASKTSNGITFTENKDGTITANGTATANATFIFQHRTDNKMLLGAGEYKVTGCPNGGSTSTYRLVTGKTSDSGTYEALITEYGSGESFTLTKDTDIYIAFDVIKGATVSNLMIRPMIRLASIADDTWEPYTGGIPSPNPDYPQDIEVSGESYNLIPYPYKDTKKELNGITFTDNGDGSVTVNGTATEDVGLNLIDPWNIDYAMLLEPNTSYILTGCPSGGSKNSYSIQYRLGDYTYENVTWGNDFGNPHTFTTTSDKVYFGCRILIISGSTIDNLVFKPMLRKASVKNDRYMLYGKGNVEVKSIGKNLLPYPYDETTHIESGVTWTDNNGIITTAGTATAMNDFLFISASTPKLLKKGTYILSGCPSGGELDKTYFLLLGKVVNGQNSRIVSDTGSGATFTLNEDTTIYLVGRFIAGTNAEGLTFKPMIRLASDTDDTYEPYKSKAATITTENGIAGIKVDNGGNYTDSNGQQWICDEIVKYADGSGEYIKRVESTVFDGSTDESWGKSGIASNISYYISKTTSGSFNAGDGGLGLLCNRFQVFKTKDLVEKDTVGCSYGYEGRGELRIGLGLSSEVNTVDLFRTWLSNNPVEMVYQLKTPSRIPLTPEQLAEIEKLSTFYPVTNISNDFDCEMSVLYVLNGENSDYISTLNNSMHSHLNKQTLDKITGVLDTASTIKANTTSGKVAGALGVKELYNELKNSFQDGCDTIVSGVTAQGITPTSNSPADIVTAINKVATNKYNAGVTATKVGTAAPGQVLNGKTFTNSSTVGATGTMPNNGAVSGSITTSGGTYTIPAGYHNGSGKVTGPTLASLVGTTVTLDGGAKVLESYTAYGKNGTKYTGSMANKGGTTQSATPSSDASYIYLPIPVNGYYNTSSKLRCGAIKHKTLNNQTIAQTGNQTITVEKQWTADVTGRLVISVMYTSFAGIANTQATCICNIDGVEQTPASDTGSGWDRNVVYSMLVTKGQKITCKTVLPETGNATHSVGQSWNVSYVS